MKNHLYDLAIRVLIYKEGNQFVAHALELDVPAYGSTEEAAKKTLESLLDNQLEFAACVGKPEMVAFPAPKDFFERWEKANRAQLRGELLSEKSLGLKGKASIFVYSNEDLVKLRTAKRRDFCKTDQLAAVA